MADNVKRGRGRGASGWRESGASLYAPGGGRKYLTRGERIRVLQVMRELEPERALFALVLAWTGARISEVLELTPARFQVDAGLVAIRTLKRRKHSMREVPIPPELMAAIAAHWNLAAAQRDAETASCRLWPWTRVTGWKLIKDVMEECGIVGVQACPRGLRHAFGVGTLQAGVPLNLASRWLGHSRLTSTAVYADASGAEEAAFAARWWQDYLEAA